MPLYPVVRTDHPAIAAAGVGTVVEVESRDVPLGHVLVAWLVTTDSPDVIVAKVDTNHGQETLTPGHSVSTTDLAEGEHACGPEPDPLALVRFDPLDYLIRRTEEPPQAVDHVRLTLAHAGTGAGAVDAPCRIVLQWADREWLLSQRRQRQGKPCGCR